MTSSIAGNSSTFRQPADLIIPTTTRWHGDPATTRPVQSRNSGPGASNSAGADDQDGDDDQPMDFPDPALTNGINGLSHDRSHSVPFINPQALRDSGVPPMPTSPLGSINSVNGINGVVGPSAPIPSSSSDQNVLNVSVTQGMLSTYLQFLQVQTQTGKMKLEYMRRREEREEKESAQRREMERSKMEREAAEFEHNKQSANVKQKADRAIVRVPVSYHRCTPLRVLAILGIARKSHSRCFCEAGGGRLSEEIIYRGLRQ